ncbi:reverse transcriptase domain-containing protein [Tanacetum coccineum]
MKIKESPNVTFDETPLPSKISSLVDDDLDEEEAIKVTDDVPSSPGLKASPSKTELDLLPIITNSLRIVLSGVKPPSGWLPVWEFATRSPTPSRDSPCASLNIVFSFVLTQIPNITTSERPPITTTVFAAITPENTPLAYYASTSTNPNPTISPAFVEANYEILESLLRERRRPIHNKDLRTELEYFSEDYDEEREMEPRPEPHKETTPTLRLREGNRRGRNTEGIGPSEIEAREEKNRNVKKRTANHGEIGEITFPPLLNVGSANPVIIKVYISGTQIPSSELKHSSCRLLRRTVVAFGRNTLGDYDWGGSHHEPVKQKKRSLAPERNEAIHSQVEELTEAGILREVKYQTWVSNPMVVKKDNGKWKLRVDFTNINKACIREPHPLPAAEQKAEGLHKYRLKCFLDAYKGYHQIPIAEKDEEKTAFFTREGVFCYKRLPFGLKNAGATYQKLIDKVFGHQMGRNMEVNADDMVIKSDSEEEMMADITETLERLRAINLKLNPKKCSFGVEEGIYSGHLITKQGIRADPSKVKVVSTLRPPKTVNEMQNLNKKIAALSRFLSKSAERTLPFMETLRTLSGGTSWFNGRKKQTNPFEE